MPYRFFLAALAACFLAAGAVRAHDDHHHHGHKHHKHKHKEEFWDGDCKVKREWKKHGEYKEERKCKGDQHARRPVHVFPARAEVVYPPWIVVQQGGPAYDPRYQPRPVVSASRCNSVTVGRVLGGIVGGTLGNQIGSGNGRVVATIGGAVAGVLIGGEVGRRMDAADHGCVGQVLEVAPVDRRVQWQENGSEYVVVPGRVVSRQGSYCRPYTVEVSMDGRRDRREGLACRRGDGVWVAG